MAEKSGWLNKALVRGSFERRSRRLWNICPKICSIDRVNIKRASFGTLGMRPRKCRRHTLLLLHHALEVRDALLQAGIVGAVREAVLVRLLRALDVALASVRGAETRVALGPLGLQLDGLLGIGDGLLDQGTARVRGGTVRVVDVVRRVEADGLGVGLDGLGEVATVQRGVTLVLELLGFGGRHGGRRVRWMVVGGESGRSVGARGIVVGGGVG